MLDEQKRCFLKRTNQDKPKYNYKEKFQHLVGLEAAEQAAKKTETNKSYGFGKFTTSKFKTKFVFYIFMIDLPIKTYIILSKHYFKPSRIIICFLNTNIHVFSYILMFYL